MHAGIRTARSKSAMDERTTIGDYEVRMIERVGSIVRFAATHVVLPRRAVVELVAADAPREDAMKLMKRACILEALQHPAVPRVFECGRLEGRPWIATASEHGTTFHDELQLRRLEMREALTLLEEVATVLCHAHSRGVLHGNISPVAIVRAPTLRLQRWENACIQNGDGAIDGREDVFALGTMIAMALARPEVVPSGFTQLLEAMIAERAHRPTAAEVTSATRAIRDAMGTFDEVDAAIEALDNEEDIVIEYAAEAEAEPEEDELILLDRPRSPLASVIVDLDACG
jgi:hypothetical protein